MKRLLLTLTTALCAVGVVPQALAIPTITLVPSSQTIGVSGSASINIVVSDLGLPPALGGFDFDLSYNLLIVSADSVVFGTGLGSSLQFSDLTTLGLIHLDEVSLETAATLLANQAGSFTLATLNFTGLALGTSPVNFIYTYQGLNQVAPALSDELGASITDSSTFTGGSITVAEASVPDGGSSLVLLGLALAGLGFAGRRRKLRPDRAI